MEISVIIPVYNKAEYLDKCFVSIFSQAFDSFEVIVVEDGSTDGSGDICDQWAELEPRLKAFHKENGGVTAARRYGLEHAEGRFIMFADADDLFTKDALAMMYRLINETGADEVIGTYDDQYGQRHDSGLRGWVEPEHLIRDLLALRSQFCVLWGIIFRRELLEGCLGTPREVIEREDSLMQIKCLMKQPKVFFTEQAAYLHYEDVPYHSAFVHHQIKVYEKFIDKKQFQVLDAYYRPLRQQLTNDIPFMDRIAIQLPARLAYLLIHTYKTLLKWKK